MMRAAALAFAVAMIAFGAGTASAQPAPGASAAPAVSPAPSASASPAASPTPRPRGLRFTNSAGLTLVDSSTNGPGQIGPEAAGFVRGDPLSPNTPYDFFSSAPLVPGVAGLGRLTTTATYFAHAFDVGVTMGLGYVRGSTTNASYWGENLMPTLNPHLGFQALPYAIAFPAHAGRDDASATRISLLSGAIETSGGDLQLRGGWFDLAQSVRFVFVPPPLTSVNPAIGYATAESLTSGVPSLDGWQPVSSSLPLYGLDLTAKRGLATFEATSAALPSLPGESARLTMGSLVLDHGEGTKYAAQVLHAVTSGVPFGTTIPSGLGAAFANTPQGVLPSSTLSGQRQTVAGASAAFHLIPAAGLDGVLEIGRSWYEAMPAARPGTQAPGGFYHAGFVKTAGRVTASLDLLRMEPRYATLILPYGVPENQWSVAFAWPGQWLKSNYQLVDNTVLGVNRQGYRLRYFIDKGPLEVHLEYTDLRQIEAETRESSMRSGFVDGYFLPQFADSATFGRQKRTALWAAWHPRFGDLTVDLVDDTEFRPFAPAHPEDRVAYEVPQGIVTFSRRLSAGTIASAGTGRYAITGTFAEPLDAWQRLFFVGLQTHTSPASALLVTYRRTMLAGITTFPASPVPPNFSGSMLLVEQRVSF